MKTIVATVILTSLLAAAAWADEPAAPAAATAPAEPAGQAPAMTPEARRECFANLSSFTWSPKADRPGVDSGDKFRAALAKCDDLLAVANDRAAMFEVHDKEAKIFARAKAHVIAAYAVLWVILIGFVALVFFRQRKLNRVISDLEAKLRRAEASGNSATG
jgi:hypothetical protein